MQESVLQEYSVPALVTLPSEAALPDLVRDNAERMPDATGYARPADDGSWENVSHAQFKDEVDRLALGFIAAGIAPGDRVAIMSRTRYEWTLCDFALWTAGAVPVPVYDSSSSDQASWILSDSGAVACIVESPRHKRTIDAVAADLPDLRHVWVITDGDLDTVARDVGDDAGLLAERRAGLTQDSLATVIYTSGTTGRPKGCELTHGNFLNTSANAIAMLPDVVGVPGASTLLFLPLAHVFARLIEVLCVQGNVVLAHTPTITDLAGKLGSFRPTFLLAVPRVFEKVYNGAEQKAISSGKGAIFARATDVAIAYSQALDAPRGPSALLRIQHAVFDRLVYSKLRAAMGGRVQWAVSGGAPLGERLGHYFRGIGIVILEGYGLTETTAPATVNGPSALRVGSVGRPLPGCTIRIAGDGEVLIKGPQVFRGYRGDPALTHEAIDADGWYHTGDLGRLADGFLRITGRKKEILVTAGGKNVAPAPLEAVIRAHPLVSQVLVVGDERPYIGALVTLDPEAVGPWLRSRDRERVDVADLIDDAEIRAEIQTAVDEANRTVSVAEQIKRWTILPVDFTEESGHLTPKLSVKRAVVIKDFAAAIDGLYL